MSIPSGAAMSNVRSPQGSGAWLFSPRWDVSLWPLPLLGTGLMMGLVQRVGQENFWGATWGWMAQYVFGNGTHVILTFLLLLVRPGLLRTTPGQPWLVGLGSAATWGVTAAVGAVAQFELAPRFSLVVTALIVAFAMQHTLSQAKGIWALYGLKAARAGAMPASSLERTLMRVHVPLGLTLILLRMFWIARAPGGLPYIDIGQSEAIATPSFAWCAAPVGIWVAYGALLARAVLRGPSLAPRALYLLGHWAIVALSLFIPLWGLSALMAMHGFEYCLLSARLLKPQSTQEKGPRGWSVPLVFLLALSPMLLVGLLTTPFLDVQRKMALLLTPSFTTWFLICTNAIVFAHYFADAFLYRLRVPQIRQVMLERLGLAEPRVRSTGLGAVPALGVLGPSAALPRLHGEAR